MKEHRVEGGKSKTVRDGIFIGLFVLLLSLPAISMPFFRNAENTEKRELAAFPKWQLEDGSWNSNYTKELDQYVMEHIGFRSALVQANAFVYSKIYQQSSESKIILGKENWLFYGETKEDYLNIPTITERNANNAARTMLLLQQYAKERGAEWVVAIVPNKSSLYGEYMPGQYKPLPQSGNLELLQEAFARYGVNYADVQEAFLAEEEVLYQSLDSHWNYKGASLGYETILRAVSFPHKDFQEIAYEAAYDWEADLAQMLYSTGAAPDRQLYPVVDFTYEITSHETAPDALRLETYCPAGQGNVVFYRDSFLNTMHVFVAESFETALFSRAYPYKADLIDQQEADVAVLEIVERNCENLVSRAPVMPAPSVTLTLNAHQMSGQGYSMYRRTSGDYMHLFGEVPDAILGPAYRAYLLVKTGEVYTSYEAFPIFEKELLGDAQLQDNGYSLYVPVESYEQAEEFYIVIETTSDAGETMYISPQLLPIVYEKE